MTHLSHTAPRPSQGLLLLVLAGPFYLNDFASIHVTDWRWWLAIDYVGVKLLPLAVVAWLLARGHVTGGQLGLRAQPVAAAVATFVVVALAGTLIDQNAYGLLEGLPGYPALGGMPPITEPLWDWVDLTLGLALVAVCEELVFRGYLAAYLERFTRNPLAIILVSSLAFGLIHWSAGLHGVLVTAVIGAVFMAAYLRTRSLPAIMAAHFAVNFIDFAGVVPKRWFTFV